jgi:hypothetical protein
MAAEVDTAVRACCRPYSARSLYTQAGRRVPAGRVGPEPVGVPEPVETATCSRYQLAATL